MRSLSHLRDDARWCTFREVATNTIPGDRTITVYECECLIAIRCIDVPPLDGSSHRQDVGFPEDGIPTAARPPDPH